MNQINSQPDWPKEMSTDKLDCYCDGSGKNLDGYCCCEFSLVQGHNGCRELCIKAFTEWQAKQPCEVQTAIETMELYRDVEKSNEKKLSYWAEANGYVKQLSVEEIRNLIWVNTRVVCYDAANIVGNIDKAAEKIHAAQSQPEVK